MAKKKRGLPDDFDLQIADDALKPADIGDFIDETIPAVRPREARPLAPRPPAEPPRTQVLELPRDRVGPAPAPPERQPIPPDPEPGHHPASRRKPLGMPRRQPRKEMTLDADTERMIREIILDVRTYSAEDDTRASEVIRALVQAAHESRRHANFENVLRRGQWGSATARGFITHLKEAFVRAIGELYIERYRHGGAGENRSS